MEARILGIIAGSRRMGGTMAVAAIVVGSLAGTALADPGDLDTSFSSDGKVTTGFTSEDDIAACVAIQADGKIVAGGFAQDKFALARYNTDGTLDGSFDGDGKVTTDFGSGFDGAFCIAIQADGKIVAAGSSGTFAKFAVARYNTDGSLDTSFSSDGKVRTDVTSGGDDSAYGVAIQSDGKIVAVGFANADKFAAVRYNTDGSLDTSYSGDGITRADLSSNFDFAVYGAVQADDRIVAAGWADFPLLAGRVPARRPTTGLAGVNTKFGVIRWNTDGSLDDSFSSDGKLTTNFSSGPDGAGSVAIQTDQKIVAAGVANNTKFAVARYNTDGTLDDSFSSDGKVRTDVGSGADSGAGVAIQADGKIVVAGLAADEKFGVARYNTDGTLDTLFGGDGTVTTDFGSGVDFANAVAIQADGKIVAAGASGNGAKFALTRYLVA
jgi:uncharacterized delta-60 repeat protein